MNKREYRQNCALSLSSDLIGERWSLLIFRELLIQNCRYGQLNEFLPGMGTNLLAKRLKELESAKLISKVKQGSSHVYALTKKGRDLEPVILQLIKWGLSHTKGERDFVHFPHWDLLAMKAMYEPLKITTTVTAQFVCEELTAWCRVTPLQCEIGMGLSDSIDIEFPYPISALRQKQRSFKEGSIARGFINCFKKTTF